MKTLLVILFLFLTVSCVNSQTMDTSKTRPRETPVAFEVLDKGISCAVTQKGQEIIGDIDSYGDMLNDMYAGQRDKIANVRKVDFDNETVIAVFYGVYRTGGADIMVNQVTDDGSGNLIVYVSEITPSKNCVVTQMTTAPYQLIRVKKKVEEVNFKMRRIENKCK